MREVPLVPNEEDRVFLGRLITLGRPVRILAHREENEEAMRRRCRLNGWVTRDDGQWVITEAGRDAYALGTDSAAVIASGGRPGT